MKSCHCAKFPARIVSPQNQLNCIPEIEPPNMRVQKTWPIS